MFKRTRAIVATVVFLIIVSILVSAAFFANREYPLGTPPLHLIVDGNFTINANSYKAYNFTMPTDISKCQVGGSFSVSGANPGKIGVFIWDNAEFTNWQSGHVSQSPLGRIISVYYSGLTTNGTIKGHHTLAAPTFLST